MLRKYHEPVLKNEKDLLVVQPNFHYEVCLS